MRPSKPELSISKDRAGKNEQYSWQECIKTIGIPDNTNESKVCELIKTTTGISATLDSLDAFHRFPSNQNDSIIIKFSKQKAKK